MGEKLSTLKRPKKYKTSENDFSHGSFFLRIGGIGETFKSTASYSYYCSFIISFKCWNALENSTSVMLVYKVGSLT